MQLPESSNQQDTGRTSFGASRRSADVQQPEGQTDRDSFESSASTHGLQEREQDSFDSFDSMHGLQHQEQSSSWDWKKHKAPARQSMDFMGQRMSDIRASLDWDFNTATPLATTRRSKEYGEKEQSSSAVWAENTTPDLPQS